MKQKIMEAIDRNAEAIIACGEYILRNPELGFKETKISAYVKEVFSKLGIPYQENLAVTGAIKDDILDTETLAGILCQRLMETAPDAFCTRYKLVKDNLTGLLPHELLEAVAKKRGFLLSGGELDTERAAAIVLDEFRAAKIGRITLEAPEAAQTETE